MNVTLSNIEALEKQFASLQLVKKHTSQEVLEDYFRGKNIDDYLRYLERVLDGSEPKKFHGFSIEEMQANLLLFLLHYVQEDKPDSLALFLRACPYYFFSLLSQKEEVTSLTSHKIERAMKSQKGSTVHHVRMRVSDFIEGRRDESENAIYETKQFSHFIFGIISPRNNELIDTIAKALVDWNRIVAPPIHDVIKVFDSVTLGVRKRTALLSQICRIEKSSDIRAALTVHVTRISTLLTRAQSGEDIETEVAYLASLLFGDVKPQLFHFFPNYDRQSCLRLFLHLFEKTGEDEYFTLVLYVLPYCAEKFHKISFKTSEKEVGLLEYLLRTPGQIEPTDLLDAVKLWYDEAKKQVEEVDEKIKLTARIIKFFCALITEGKNTIGASYDFLHTFAEWVGNPVDLPKVLYSLRHDDAVKGLAWISALNPCEIEVLVHILNRPAFPMCKREEYFSFLLKTNLLLATRLTPQLSQDMISKILAALEKSNDASLPLAAMRNLINGLAYSAVRDAVVHNIAQSSRLRTVACMIFFASLEEPGIQVFALMTKAAPFPEGIRKAIVEGLVSAELSSQHWKVALYFLKPSDTAEIAQFLTNIRAKQEDEKYLLSQATQNHIAQELTDCMIRLLLEEGTAKAIGLGAQLFGKLVPLSALRRFLKKAMYLTKEEAHEAISPLFKAVWSNDPVRTENNPDWFSKMKIQHIPDNFYSNPRRGNFRPSWYTYNKLAVFTPDDEIYTAFVERIASLGFDRKEIIQKLDFAWLLEHRQSHNKASSKYRATLIQQHHKKTK